jgi:gas vesicle protein
MSVTVMPENTQSEFKTRMHLAKHEADARLALIAAGHAPAPSAFDRMFAVASSPPNARAAALVPDHVIEALVRQAKPLPPEIKRAFANHRDAGLNLINRAQTDAVTATNQRVADIKRGKGSNDDFRAKLKAQAKKNVDDYQEKEFGLVDKLGDLGEKHPEAQDAILSTYQAISGIFTTAWSKVGTVLKELVSHVVTWLATAADKVTHAIKDIANKAGDAIKSINPF